MVEKFDNELLISLVKTRPMLWDKSLESHKDLNQRSGAWREICRTMRPEYETLSRKDKHFFAKSVIRKWTNIRDAWRKSLMETKLKKKVKPYLYHDSLKFLEKNLYHQKESVLDEGDQTSVVQTEETEKVEKLERIDKYSFAESDDTSDAHSAGAVSRDGDSSRSRRRKIREICEPDSIRIMEAKSLRTQKVESPHICFVRGLLPTLNKLDDDEVLDFQGGVIQLLQGIRKRRALVDSDVIPNDGFPSSSIDISNVKEDIGEM